MNTKELVDFVNTVDKGKAKYIEEYKAYALNINNFIGVAIDCEEGLIINERFNKIKISNANLTYKDELHHVIFLYTEDAVLNEDYGLLFLSFLSLGKREVVSKKPLQWFEDWSNLLGNKKQDKMIYDVLGELETLIMLCKSGQEPKWDSAQKGTYDISAGNVLYEVKTTKNKTENFVTIHNQYQLDSENKNLHLVFVRVEESDSGVSIDDLYNKLVGLNYKDIGNVESYLRTLGYYAGKSERYAKFMIHEIRDYLVNEKFPRISKSDFKNGQFPNRVVKIEYTISLDGLEYKILAQEGTKDA